MSEEETDRTWISGVAFRGGQVGFGISGSFGHDNHRCRSSSLDPDHGFVESEMQTLQALVEVADFRLVLTQSLTLETNGFLSGGRSRWLHLGQIVL